MFGPRASLASLRGGIDTLAAVRLRVEQRTSALTPHHAGATGRLEG